MQNLISGHIQDTVSDFRAPLFGGTSLLLYDEFNKVKFQYTSLNLYYMKYCKTDNSILSEIPIQKDHPSMIIKQSFLGEKSQHGINFLLDTEL